MQSVLFVSHGSRDPEAVIEAKAFLTAVMEQIDVPLAEISFLELTEPSIEQGIQMLVKQGASKIAVIPVLLLVGGHYWNDIPAFINRSKAEYPNIYFTYGEPLGFQHRIIQVLADRIKERNIQPNTNVLLVGRGSRNEKTREAVEKVANALQEEIGRPIHTCYLAVLNPSFEQMVQSLSKKSQLIVVPYLWFTGVLTKYIEKKSESLQAENRDIIVCRHLGDHIKMREALKEKVYEAIESKEAVHS